ncbi:MAG: hypothetical protein ACPLRH_00035 [Desulfotomaculales bacterium]
MTAKSPWQCERCDAQFEYIYQPNPYIPAKYLCSTHYEDLLDHTCTECGEESPDVLRIKDGLTLCPECLADYKNDLLRMVANNLEVVVNILRGAEKEAQTAKERISEIARSYGDGKENPHVALGAYREEVKFQGGKCGRLAGLLEKVLAEVKLVL